MLQPVNEIDPRPILSDRLVKPNKRFPCAFV